MTKGAVAPSLHVKKGPVVNVKCKGVMCSRVRITGWGRTSVFFVLTINQHADMW